MPNEPIDSRPALDRLLREADLPVPDAFAERLMGQLPAQRAPLPWPEPAATTPLPRWRRAARALLWLGGGALGLSQLLAYVFAVWLASSAG
ncbi:MAG: hypothetical protein RLY71_4059 [Pseudomonadota bacterium]|jgi:ferric-dicitrate binding protein FerR (iron transport regulator)